MKIGGSRGVGGTSGVSRPSSVRRASPAGKATATRKIQDVASIMDIAPAEMNDKVRGAIMVLLEEVSALRGELEAAQARLAEMELLVDQDPLIPIHNRRAFVREMSRLISFAQRYGTPSSLVYLDLNEIKKVNDQLGHAAGDQALLYVAEQLVRNVRDVDIVGRLGGDEFGVLLVQTDEEQALAKAESLAKTIADKPLEWEGLTIPLSLAFGVTTFTEAASPNEALADADRRMYENKRQLKAEN